ncbi:Fe-S cluster assembly protein SufD [Acidiphilium sp.]|uniref:Fe-S cluster assembly protein SufD n=1 Tax=Acidiphilium sp. TaxID=527 RepID=UPI003D0732F2
MSATNFLDRIDFSRLTGAAAQREAAADRFRALGWPTRANEAWHYTDLNARLKSFNLTLATSGGDVAGMVPDTELPCVVFTNGRYDEIRSTASSFVTRWRGDDVNVVTPDLPMVTFNTAVAEDGACVAVPDATDAGTMFLVSAVNVSDQAVITPRHRVSIGAGASLTLIEIARGIGSYLHSPVVEILLGKGAVLRHYRLQDDAPAAVHVTTVVVTIAEDASYQSFTLNCGARLSRNETHVSMIGSGGDVHLNAAQLLSGAQLGDVTTVIAHEAPHCASRQTVKSILAGSARGVFQGRIEVARGAQKTDGYQMNQTLLLSPDAEIDSKPELEIFADDVKCSHGATIGALDPEQIFYLRSRGIPESQARAMLVRAFLDEALEPVADHAARILFESAVEAWWQEDVL